MKQPVCHNCQWLPVPHIPYWECECGAKVDVFGEQGVCPSCEEKMGAARCPKCAIIKSYGWWTGLDVEENQGVKIADVIVPNACVTLQERAAAWVRNKERYLASNFIIRIVWLNVLIQKEITEEQVNDCIYQISCGKGFVIHYPVEKIGLSIMEPAIKLLGGQITESHVAEKGITDRGITDAYTIHLHDGSTCNVYHLISSDEI